MGDATRKLPLIGVRRQKFNTYPKSRKTAILGPILTGLQNFSTKNRFTMGGVFPCKLPLIVVVAPYKLYSE